MCFSHMKSCYPILSSELILEYCSPFPELLCSSFSGAGGVLPADCGTGGPAAAAVEGRGGQGDTHAAEAGGVDPRPATEAEGSGNSCGWL